MKKYIFLMLVCSFCWTSFSQSQAENIFFSKNNDGSYKFHFSESFNLTCEKRAEYYSHLNFNSEHFVLEDSLKIFYSKDKKIHLKGFYKNGLKQGEFTWYYPNGTIKSIGYYDQDKRIGIWRNYYQNGQISKEINYIDELAFLKSFYLENGAQLVSEGEGVYMEEIALYNNPKNLRKIKGNVKDGLMDGKWDMYLQNSIISSEYFENKTFVKGISYAGGSKSEYTDTYFTTFLETNFFEKITFDSELFCGARPGGSGIQFSFVLFESIKKNYSKTDLPKEVANGWFFIKLSYDKKGNIIFPEIISNQSEEINNKLLSVIFKTKNDYKCYNLDMLVTIAIADNEIYFSDSDQIRLFNRH